MKFRAIWNGSAAMSDDEMAKYAAAAMTPYVRSTPACSGEELDRLRAESRREAQECREYFEAAEALVARFHGGELPPLGEVEAVLRMPGLDQQVTFADRLRDMLMLHIARGLT